MGIGRDLTEIAGLFIGVALVALLVSNPQGTSQVIGATTGGFGDLLSIVTLQNKYRNPLAS